MAEIVMPRLSDSMEEGTILQWIKQVGDEVAIGDELVEIETDKANMAYESDVAGTLTEVLAQEGDTLPIGTPIAVVGDAVEGGETGRDEGGQPAGPATEGDSPTHPSGSSPSVSPAGAGDVDETAAPTVVEAVREEPAVAGSGSSNGERVKASPLARRIAKDAGIDLAGVKGSGPGGRIIKRDVERTSVPGGGAEMGGPRGAEDAEHPSTVGEISVTGPAGTDAGSSSTSPETAKGQTTYEDLTKLQQVIARRMSESKATAPHFYLQAEIDMSQAVEARKRLKAMAGEGEVVPSFNDMVVKACALALKEHPRANGAYRDGRFELYSRVNVGVAVAAQDALVVPTVFDADQKGLRQIATEARALAAKVRAATITPPELSGGTFTVSNLGMYGIDNFSAVINTPQAAILAVGAIKERPVVRAGELTSAQMLYVTLACDHRILYGAPAAEFLARVRALLEEPLSLAL
jgi:pyruvate dehydrogenase E2 component (dihydrolipoamide acetyltransferase)